MSAPLVLAVDGRVLDDRYHGIGRITEALLRSLAGRPGLRVVVFVHPGQRTTRFDLTAVVEGNGHARAVFEHTLTAPRQYLAWPGALRRAGAEVGLFPYHLGAPLWGRTPTWAVVHDCILEAHRDFAPDALTRLLYRWSTRWVIRHNRVLTPSSASAAEIGRWYGRLVPPEDVLPWGVDDAWSGDTAPVVDGRPLPTDYLLHVGARRPHKNVGVVVRALAELPEPLSLVLVGSPDPRWDDEVPAAVERLGLTGRVHQLRSVTDAELGSLYAHARAVVQPSLVEGFGLPVLEAMAAGAPVVAADVPVLREVAGMPGGDAALWADPRDHRAWVRAIGLLDDPATVSALRAAGRRRVARATWTATTDRLVERLTSTAPVRTALVHTTPDPTPERPPMSSSAPPTTLRTGDPTGPSVVVLGDSTAAGLGVRGRSYGTVLAEQLGARRVRRLARSEHTVRHALAHLPALAEDRPDLVVVGVGGADAVVHVARPVHRLVARFAPESWGGTTGLEPRAVLPEGRRARVRQLVGTAGKLAVKHVGVRVGSGWVRTELEDFAELYPQLVDGLLDLGATVVTVSSHLVDARLFPRSPASIQRYNAVIEAVVAARPQVVHVRAEGLLDRWSDFLPDHCHATPAGHAKIAAAIARALDEARAAESATV